jgi:hypothetical protein
MSRCTLALFSMFLIAAAAWTPTSYVVALGAASAGARSPEAKIHAPYPDSAQGLKQELKDMRELARSRKSVQLRAMITDLEIPNDRAWYLANFGASGLETADKYEKGLTKSEERIENQMIEFAREDGYFSVKKQDAKKAFPNIVTAPDVFLASWDKSPLYGADSDSTPFGYFLFIDGKFRWDSTSMWVTVD